ncbi:hypothetical protein GS399_14135 [Pedobacter sp. HMF7647]|uniref:SMP-30/Gluconolactonase/LRE-like region domain-containing protein n=1 Tax=Hufsiella arboris TaxID=2695275 RepID=A0A7K1YC04_9SPHI|nr:hypothetical protein [Hufsiella arboris]MXV52113.1 hypothetical protein [Hufsiella arboris]
MKAFKYTELILFLLFVFCLANCKKDSDDYSYRSSDVALTDGLGKNKVSALADSFYVSTYTTTTLPYLSRLGSAPDGTIYASDYPDDKVFKISPGGIVSVLAEGLNSPFGLKVAKNGDVYVALYFDNRIVKITPQGTVSPVNVGISLSRPTDLAIADNGTLYIADAWHRRIIKLPPAGNASVIAGSGAYGIVDGKGGKARFGYVTTLKLAGDGMLYAIDSKTDSTEITYIRRISLNGEVSTLLRMDGYKEGRRLKDLSSSKRDSVFGQAAHENLFTVNSDNTISFVNLSTRTVKLLSPEPPSSGNFGYVDGPLSSAKFRSINGLSIRSTGIYVADAGNRVIRRIYKR